MGVGFVIMIVKRTRVCEFREVDTGENGESWLHNCIEYPDCFYGVGLYAIAILALEVTYGCQMSRHKLPNLGGGLQPLIRI
jgi:hypothetical protein